MRAAGWLYLAASHAGTLCLFAFFAALAARTGSWDLGPMRERAELAPLFWLALVGFGMKAGLFPLHIWLPSAHANAPSHVSAILSGVTIKMGIYGLVRFSGWLPVPRGRGWVVAALGVASAVLAWPSRSASTTSSACSPTTASRTSASSSSGSGFALVAAAHGDAAWGRLALAGGLLHVWNHGLFKALLFLGAGSVLHATGTREMSRLGGLWRAMPWTAGLLRRWARRRSPACRRSTASSASGWSTSDCSTRSPRGGPVGVGGGAGRGAARRDRRAGAGVLRQGVRRGLPRRAAHRAPRPSAHECGWLDARPDARARGGVRGDRAGAGAVLAGDRARGARVAAGVDRCWPHRAPLRHARRMARRAGRWSGAWRPWRLWRRVRAQRRQPRA